MNSRGMRPEVPERVRAGAREDGLASVECYRAGVDAWRRVHPDQSAEYAAKQAVAVILAAKVSLRVEE